MTLVTLEASATILCSTRRAHFGCWTSSGIPIFGAVNSMDIHWCYKSCACLVTIKIHQHLGNLNFYPGTHLSFVPFSSCYASNFYPKGASRSSCCLQEAPKIVRLTTGLRSVILRTYSFWLYIYQFPHYSATRTRVSQNHARHPKSLGSATSLEH